MGMPSKASIKTQLTEAKAKVEGIPGTPEDIPVIKEVLLGIIDMMLKMM